jgi:pimeloyl-ACP methyl ester carboxylesterase
MSKRVMRLNVESSGPRSGPTVVLVHGVGDDLHTFDHLREHLAARRIRAVAYDHAGFGSSPGRGPGPVDIHDLASDLADVIAAQPSGPVVLLGHSMGSLTVLALASQQPELFGPRVTAVILAASPGTGRGISMGLPDWCNPVARRIAPALFTVLNRFNRESAFERFFFRTIAALAYGTSTTAERHALASKVAGVSPQTLIDHLIGCLRFDDRVGETVLGRVRTWVVVGAKDHLVSPAAGRRLAASIPHAVLVDLKASGHMMHLEDPAAITALLDEACTPVTVRA